MRKMWIIAVICLCQALAAESGSVIKSKTKSPTVTDNEKTTFISLTEDEMTVVSLTEDETTTVISLTEDEMTAVSLTEDETTTAISLISRGTEAKDGEFPCVIALRGDKKEASIGCTAIILSERTVLTAAHCVSNGDPMSAENLIGHAGSLNMSSPAIDIEFKDIQIHPNYNKHGSLEDDIAVLKTKERIKFTKNVNKICIESKKTNRKGYQNLKAVGWGRSGEDGDNRVLHYHGMKFLDNDECPYNSTVKQSVICAHAINGDICPGDSGGPLVEYMRKKKAVLVGITSYLISDSKESMGVTSGDDSKVCGNTAVFVRISHYNDFIKKASGKDHGICIMSD